MKPIVGLHHVTAFASDPQRNLDFYTRVLGQRFVKKTVNFDDPGTYHFYFGDDGGSPGTIMTSFPWPRAARGVVGAGETSHVAYAVAAGSLGYWQERLVSFGVAVGAITRRFGEQVLGFEDPDGMKLELVAAADVPAITPSRFSEIPAEHALRGFFGVTLLERDLAKTEPTLRRMGFAELAREGSRVRFMPAAGSDETTFGTHIDVVLDPAAARGRMGAGIIHHIAFRAADSASQLEWRAELEQTLSVTTVQERDYFQSIYFREPGGVLFELATDPPGFTRDEPVETLGERLCLPAWLEPRRAELERHLMPVTIPEVAA